MKRFTAFVAALFFLAVVPAVFAQTAPSIAPLGTYQISGGYTSVSGPTDNGTLVSFNRMLAPRVRAVAKVFLLSNPSGVTIITGSPRYQPPLSALWKPSPNFDTSKIQPFIDLNLGVAKSTNGGTRFAYGAGVGLDYQVSPNVTLLLIEADRIQSSILPAGGITISNLNTFTTGIKLGF